MSDTLPARLAARLSTPLLILAAACFALPFAALPGAGGASGVAFAAGRAGSHPEAVAAAALVLAALAASLVRRRHSISALVLTSGFATGALLLLRATVATAARDSSDRVAESLGGFGSSTFGMLGSAVQQQLALRWTAAYWVALLAAAAVFLLNSWALLRQPEPAQTTPPAPPARTARWALSRARVAAPAGRRSSPPRRG